MTPEDTEAFMRRAITLARAQVGRTGANPAVGCVIVQRGAVIAEAATGDGGRPHAEESALAMAGAQAAGAAVFVTLEPCAERSGKGRSCAHRLVEAGVGEVHIACHDASVFASGKGVAVMLTGGVSVRGGVLEREAAPIYANYTPLPDKPLERRD